MLRSRTALDFLWLFAVTLFAGFIYTDELINKGATLWDNFFFYSLFYNQIDSLHRFGEFAYWFPSNQLGWPAYYYSILGDVNCVSPVFAVVGVIAWIAGRLGFEISVFALFTAYYGFLAPLAVNLGVYAVARQLFHSRSAILFAIVLSAFSPGTLVNVSDVGFLEPCAYALYFMAAWLNFTRDPRPWAYWALVAASGALVFNISFPFLMFSLVFVPVFVILATLIPEKGLANLKSCLRQVPAVSWILGSVAIALCLLPPLLTFAGEKELIRSSIGTEVYNFRSIRVGNPFEMFTISLPQFGFEAGETSWALFQGGKGKWISTCYIALLALPLSILALVFGRRVLRVGGFFSMFVLATMVALSAWNPFVSLLVRFIRPLQSNQHWGDLGFRGGGYLIFIFLSTLGFEMLDNGHQKALKWLPWMIGVSCAASISVYFIFEGQAMFNNHTFALMMALSVGFLLLSIWLGSNGSRRTRKMVVGSILAFTLLDVSTFAFNHMRATMNTLGYKALVRPETPDPERPGLLASGDDFAERILMLSPHFDLYQAQLNPWQMPPFKLFNSARLAGEGFRIPKMIQEKELLAKGVENYNSLILDSNAKEIAEFGRYLNNSQPSPVSGSVNIVKQTYNELSFQLKSAQDAMLFVRDAYSPHWKVWVNGVRVPVVRGLFNYKVIPVPQGESQVDMKFEPFGLRYALWFAYLAMATAVAISLIQYRKITARSERSNRPRR